MNPPEDESPEQTIARIEAGKATANEKILMEMARIVALWLTEQTFSGVVEYRTDGTSLLFTYVRAQ